MEEPLRPGVVICGPPGTEPRPGFSSTRLDTSESLVYSRCSTSLTCLSSPLQKYVIPLKRTQRELLEVEIFVRNEDSNPRLRQTRAMTKMFEVPKEKASSSESESDASVDITSDSEASESEDEFCARLNRRFKTMSRNRRTGPSRVRHPSACKLKVCIALITLDRYIQTGSSQHLPAPNAHICVKNGTSNYFMQI